jgi:hypothetical protein
LVFEKPDSGLSNRQSESLQRIAPLLGEVESLSLSLARVGHGTPLGCKDGR